MRVLAPGASPLPLGCRCSWLARIPIRARRLTCAALQQADLPAFLMPERQQIVCETEYCLPIRQAAGKVVHTDGSGSCITYRRAIDLSPAQIEALLAKVEWPAEHRAALQAALQNSFFIGSLESPDKPEEERLVGLVRVVSDGAFNAQLWDTLVDPQYQGLELDKSLLKEVIRELVSMGVTNITALASKSGWKQYEKIGFQHSPDGVTSMCWQGRKVR